VEASEIHLKTLSLLLASVLCLSFLAGMLPAAQASSSEETPLAKKASALFNMASKTGDRVHRLIEKLEQKGVTVPQKAKDAYEEGEGFLEQAETLLEEGNYQESVRYSFKALASFREALSRIFKLGVLRENTAATLKEAIERCEKTVERLRELLGRLEEAGYSGEQLEAAKSRLNEASMKLKEATELLEKGEISEAAKRLGEARKLIAGSEGELIKLVKPFHVKRIEKYLERLEQRMEALKHKVEASKMPKHAKEKVLKALSRAIYHIEKAREHLKGEALSRAYGEAEAASLQLAQMGIL